VTVVLYIAGSGRSGTTILDNLLGQVDGFVSVGELRHIWQRGILDERSCGCGRPLLECDFWTKAFSAGFGGEPDARGALAAMAESARTRDVRSLVRTKQQGRVLEDCSYAPYLRGLYDGIVAASGARVIVDSSKFPADAIVASGLPGYDVYVLHAVRDPRAVAFSWQRRRTVADKDGGLGQFRREGLVRSTATWQIFNASTRGSVRRAVGSERYRLLRYEDLAREPERHFAEVIDFVGQSSARRPEFDGNEVEVRPSHTAFGNFRRFATGRTTITLDREWEQKMPHWQKAAVTALAMPMLLPMGYSLRV